MSNFERARLAAKAGKRIASKIIQREGRAVAFRFVDQLERTAATIAVTNRTDYSELTLADEMVCLARAAGARSALANARR